MSIQNQTQPAAIFAFQSLSFVGYLSIAITGTNCIVISLISARPYSQKIEKSSQGIIFSSIKAISAHIVIEYLPSSISAICFLKVSISISFQEILTILLFIILQIKIHFHLLHLFGFTTNSFHSSFEKS